MAKILIVEDEKAINDLVKFNLELIYRNPLTIFKDVQVEPLYELSVEALSTIIILSKTL